MVKQNLSVKFGKKGMMRFVSHLDLMRLFSRASRRAALPVTITQGFNPHPRISIQPALKLGLESDSLEALFRLDTWVKPPEFKERLQAVLPEGIDITEIEVA